MLKIITTALALMLLTTAACTDLAPVREWSGASSRIAAFGAGADAYAERPLDHIRFAPEQAEALREEAEIRKGDVSQLKALSGVVSGYMVALNALAADGALDVGKEITETAGKVDGIGLDADTANAVGSIVAAVANAGLSAFQAAKVSALVEDANAPLQTVLEGMTEISSSFEFAVMAERARIFDGFVDHQPKPSSLIVFVLWDDWVIAQDRRLTTELEAAQELTKAIRTIAEGHQALFDNRDNIDAEVLVKQLVPEARAIAKAIGKVQEAFDD